MSYEDLKCPACGCVGKNTIDPYIVSEHPNVEEDWVVCQCGEYIRAVSELE